MLTLLRVTYYKKPLQICAMYCINSPSEQLFLLSEAFHNLS